jgi:hypothetical protein
VFARRSVIAFLMCSVMLLAAQAGQAMAKEEHFLDYSEDNFKVVFISENLTAAVTHDWPRVVFEHSTDPFSPTFEVGLPRIFLYNDSNGDGYFATSETTYVSYLDENHVLWNVTPVEFYNDSLAGECAAFRMNATLALYEGLTNETIAIHDWANVTFWFRISQRGYYESNSLGSFLVRGKTDLTFNFTLDILKSVNTTGVVMEQLIQGGGSTYMFLVRQLGRYHSVIDQFVSGRVDETVFGTNFTNGFYATTLPDQQISFAKDDRTIQAYYRWDSEPTMVDSDGNSSVPVTSDSYFTTGTGLMLDSSFVIGNKTGSIYQMSIIGIDESAFSGKISDWLKNNIWGVIAFTAVMAAVISISAFGIGWSRKRKLKDKARIDLDSGKEKKE